MLIRGERIIRKKGGEKKKERRGEEKLEAHDATLT